MPFISAIVIFPVPISKPLYTCLESAEIISPLNFFAIFTARSLLPVAVGPRITKIFLGLDFFMNNVTLYDGSGYTARRIW